MSYGDLQWYLWNKNGKRILFVGLNCEEERNKLLIHAKKHKDIVDYKDVYINKDLTKSQPEQQKNLRQELRNKRNKNPTKTFTIKHDQVSQRN